VADEERHGKEPVVSASENLKPSHYFSLSKFQNANIPELSYKKQLFTRVVFQTEVIAARFRSAVLREFETGLSFHFSPVFLGFGVVTYYSVPSEPLFLALALMPLCLFAVLRMLNFHGKLYYLLAACLCVSLGMAAAKLETNRISAPIIERQITTQMQGMILNVDQNRRGSPRYLIKPISMDGVNAEQLPKKVRASAASKHEVMKPGDVISGRIRLQPVTGPAYPGGYDFSFFAWQNGLGGSGFFMGKPERLVSARYALDWHEQLQLRVNLVRQAIEARIIKALPDYTGGIAIALITGNRTGIPQDAQENLRKTGLAHILAISGLHMALVSLTLISTIRFLLSRNTHLVLHYPIKKWSVIAGFFSATIYLFLSGGAIATQRAWIMISVMLLAILLDRKSITIRSVVVSAIIILLISPSSLLSPGFQMSFAAVASLVAGYEVINIRRQKRLANQLFFVQPSRLRRWVGDIWRYFMGIAITSLIAGTATAFIAAWHFHQVAPLGLVANLAAMPIVALVVMPSLLGAMILMPYGLDVVPFTIASFGIDWIVNIAAWIEMQSPDGNTGLVSRHMLVTFALFLSALTLMKTRLRYLSLGIVPLLFLGFKQVPAPDIIIAENGRAIGVKSASGKLVSLYPRSSKFTQEIWQKAWGRESLEESQLKVLECTREQCITELAGGQLFYVVYNPDLLQEACTKANILAAPRLWWVNCREGEPELILKRRDFEQYGTHSMYIKTEQSGYSIKLMTALPEPSRPWHRRVSEK